MVNEEKKTNLFLNKIKISKKNNYDFLNYAFYMNKKKFELNVKYFEKLLILNKNDIGILYIILKLSFKNLNHSLLSRTLEIMDNSLDDIQGDPIIELSEILNQSSRSKKIKKIFCQKYIYKIIDNSKYKKLKKIFLRDFVDCALFGKCLKASMFKKICKINDYYELAWFAKEIINLNYRDMGKKFLLKSLSLRKNEVHNEFIAYILIKKNLNNLAFKVLNQSDHKKFYDKSYALLYYLSKFKKNITDIKYKLIINLFSNSHNLYNDLPSWR